jgi:hypothetical protein
MVFGASPAELAFLQPAALTVISAAVSAQSNREAVFIRQ